MMDAGFLGKIDGPFICLIAAILWHSLRCWQSGIIEDKVAFTRSSAGGGIRNVDLWFSKVSGFL